MYTQLERYSPMMGDPTKPPATGKFGTCTIRDSVIVSATGTKIAELGCGLLVHVPGVADFVGAQVGTPATVIIERYKDAEKRAACIAGRNETRCWFSNGDAEQPYTRYTVAGVPAKPLLRGKAALAFFAPRRVIRFHATMHCH